MELPPLKPPFSQEAPPHITLASGISDYSQLTAQTLQGISWNILGSVLSKGLILIGSIVVSRQLKPDDFAVAGIGTTVIGLVTAMSAQGFAMALIREPELRMTQCHTVFWFLLVVGVALFGLMVMAFPWLVHFYHLPALSKVLLVLGAVLVISLAGSVPDALLNRHMRFRQKSVIGLLGTLFSVALGISIALLGYGYWALVIPTAGNALALVVGAFWVSGYRPALFFSWKELCTMGRFGFSMVGSSLLNYLSDNSDYLIMGRLYSQDAFGQYYFAYERSRQPFQLISGQISGVVYPAFSRIQHDLNRIRWAYIRGTRMLALLTFPVYALLVGLADPLLPWIFGNQWLPAIPLFQVFAAFCIVRTFGLLVSAPLMALDFVHYCLLFNLFRVVVSLPILLILGLSGTNIFTLALILTIVWTIQAPFFIGIFYYIVHLRMEDFFLAFGRLLLALLFMAAMLLGIRLGASALQLSDMMMTAAAIVISSGFYVLISWPLIKEMIQLLGSNILKK